MFEKVYRMALTEAENMRAERLEIIEQYNTGTALCLMISVPNMMPN